MNTNPSARRPTIWSDRLLQKSSAQWCKRWQRSRCSRVSIVSIARKCFSRRLIKGIGNFSITTFFSATTISLQWVTHTEKCMSKEPTKWTILMNYPSNKANSNWANWLLSYSELTSSVDERWPKKINTKYTNRTIQTWSADVLYTWLVAFPGRGQQTSGLQISCSTVQTINET